jgi:hypothetical protein
MLPASGQSGADENAAIWHAFAKARMIDLATLHDEAVWFATNARTILQALQAKLPLASHLQNTKKAAH